jgi:hypothetical protein
LRVKLGEDSSPFKQWLQPLTHDAENNEDADRKQSTERTDGDIDLDAELLQLPKPSSNQRRNSTSRGLDKSTQILLSHHQQHQYQVTGKAQANANNSTNHSHPQIHGHPHAPTSHVHTNPQQPRAPGSDEKAKSKPEPDVQMKNVTTTEDVASVKPKMEERSPSDLPSEKQSGVKRPWSEMQEVTDANLYPARKRIKPDKEIESMRSEDDILSHWGSTMTKEPVLPTASTAGIFFPNDDYTKISTGQDYSTKSSLVVFGNTLEQFQQAMAAAYQDPDEEKRREKKDAARSLLLDILRSLEDQGQNVDRSKSMDHLQTVMGV